VEPWIEAAEISRPGRRTMSRALWQWLERKRKEAGDAQLPGRAFSGALTLVGLAALGLSFTAGAGIVLSLLNQYDGRTFHVLGLIALTIGVQWILLLLSGLGFLTWGWFRRQGAVSGAQRLLSASLNQLVRRSLGEDAANWWRETSRSRRLFGLPILALSQWAGLAFTLGSLAALVGAVSLLSVRFGWETTTVETMAPAVEEGVRVLSAPWSWVRPDWVPSAEVIRGTLITWEDRKPRMPPAALSSQWYPFLVASVGVWALAPRLILVVLMSMLRHRALQRYSFQERVHREWWRHLTELEVHAVVSGPADGACVILLGGLEEPQDLRRACLQQLRLNLEERVILGAGSLEDDDRAFRTAENYAARSKDGRLVLVAEGWALVPKEFQEVHARLRQSIGPSTPVDVLLIGLPGPGGALGAPSADEITMWERFAGELGDPNLYLQPFQPILAH
jgi:hypothetical protein